ncbi:MAG: BCCT family transporter, partial [Polyangiales bacterium]
MGWLYVLAVNVFLGLCLWLAFSQYAGLRLGKEGERPEFSTLTWYAMLFSAGMGIGLVFHGVAEPVHHFAHPPGGTGHTAEAARAALPITYLHWGVHAWSIYAVVALTIAFFSFRHDLPLTLRSCLYPLLGEQIHSWPGHTIDILAVISTLFGLACSLGLGAMQVAAGLEYLFSAPNNIQTQLIIIAVITAGATLSLLTGMKRGIRRLSELNIVLASILMLLVFVFGPTRDIVTAATQSVGPYVGDLFRRAFYLGSFNHRATEWSINWTITYWAWWIAWAPFVGLFIARISRGRTMREFILGTLLVPTGMNIAWFSIFGGTALQLDITQAAGIAEVATNSPPTAIFAMLSHLPAAELLSLLAVAVVSVFFVTSSDSASLVVDMLTSGGHPNPPVWQRIFWATAEGATASVLLYAGATALQPGKVARPAAALEALQAGVISMGLPFCVVLLLMSVSLVLGLWREHAGYPLGPEATTRRRPTAPKPIVPMKLARILVPVDFSTHSDRAVEHALGLAKLNDPPGEVHLLHVAPEPAAYLPLETLIRDDDRSLEDVIEAHTAQFRLRMQAYLGQRQVNTQPLAGHVERGVPWKRIVDVAQRGRFDLIVMGSPGSADPSSL